MTIVLSTIAYLIISAIITKYWLGWDFPFCLIGFIGLPIAIVVFIITRIFRKNIVINDVEIDFD